MIAILKHFDSAISINAMLDIEVDNLAFRLNVDENEAIILIDRWKDMLTLTRHFSVDSNSFKHVFTELDSELKRLDINVYVRKRNFALMGPKANPILATLIKNFVPVLIA